MLGPGHDRALDNYARRIYSVLVAIDKFTKWIQYKPVTKFSADQVVSFICDILHRFGFPHTIITDLGSNFHSH
jgi:spore maturation protein CgeB